MRVETTRSAGVVRLRHGAGFTTSADDVVAQARPLVAAARMRGEPVALAVRPATAEALAAALAAAPPPARARQPCPADASTGARDRAAGSRLGPRADGGADPPVLLARPDGPDRSGQTLAARWARELRALTRRPGAGSP